MKVCWQNLSSVSLGGLTTLNGYSWVPEHPSYFKTSFFLFLLLTNSGPIRTRLENLLIILKMTSLQCVDRCQINRWWIESLFKEEVNRADVMPYIWCYKLFSDASQCAFEWFWIDCKKKKKKSFNIRYTDIHRLRLLGLFTQPFDLFFHLVPKLLLD